MSTIEKAAAKLVAKQHSNAQENGHNPRIDESLIHEPSEFNADLGGALPTDTVPYEVDDTQAEPQEEVGVAAPAAAGPAYKSVRLSVPRRNLTHMCELDFAWLGENGFLVPGHDNKQQALEFRRIKRPLLLNTEKKHSEPRAHPANLVFITSALASEGKTYVALNLALSLAAELDRSVLLIDGDVAKGDLSKWMGIHEEIGLGDLLADGNKFAEDLVFGTNVERLEVLPCGRVAENLDELFASDLMDEVMERLASQFPQRVLVVDGPPLLATTEASVLAHHMGQVVLVVESNKTPQSAVQQAASQLENCQDVSVLLNKVSRGESSGYGYGYGYGYGVRHAADRGPPSQRVEEGT